MIQDFYIARRFAFKQRSATRPTFIVFLAIVGISVGTAALILTLSIVNGFAGNIEQKLIGFTSHLQIRQPDDRLFRDDETRLEAIRLDSNIAAASAFLEQGFVLRSRRGRQQPGWNSHPVLLRGISQQERNRFLLQFGMKGTSDRLPEAGDLRLTVGKSLAETLHLNQGDRVMLVGMGQNKESGVVFGSNMPAGNLTTMLAELDVESGFIETIYETGLQDGFDNSVILMELGQMQNRFHPGMISGYDANVRDIRNLEPTLQRIVNKIGTPFFGYTVFERYANLFEWLKLQKNISPLLIITITVVAVFNIIATLLVLIIEKTREIGMLSALGMTPHHIARIFLMQAFLVGLVGIVLGNLLAWVLTVIELRYHFISLPEKSYFINHIPLSLDASHYLFVSAAVILLTMLFAVIPARVASSLKPSQALST